MKKQKEFNAITKSAYQRKIKAFHRNHEWLRPFTHLKPAPGHIGLCEKMFKDIEQLIGQEINNYFTEFYIFDEGTKLNVIFSLNENLKSDSLKIALRQITNSTRYFSTITCAICGSLFTEIKYVILPSNNYCKLHNQLIQIGVLSKEEIDHYQINEEQLFQKREDFTDKKKETKKRLFENQDPPQDSLKGYARIFDPNDFLKLSEKIERMNRDSQSRFNQIIERTADAGQTGYRKLATFNDAHAKLDKFIEDFPNFTQLGNHFKDLASLFELGDSRIKTPPLLLLGEPGIGKTEACYRISQMFETGFKSFDMSSAQSGAFLMGSDSFWSNSQVGKLFEQICYNNCANPLIMLDELDKASSDSRFDPVGGLYSLLEETTAKNFMDLSCKDIKLDMSHINWIATANDMKNIPEPILTRFLILEISKPDAQQSRNIAKNIYLKILESHAWGHFFEAELDDQVTDLLLTIAPRVQKRTLLRGLAKAARQGRKKLNESDVKTINVKQNQIGFIH